MSESAPPLRSLLRQRELKQRAVEAAAWAETHADEWTQLVRDIVLTCEKLRALETRAAELPASLRQMLPLSHLIGPRPVLNVNWMSDPISALRTEALRLGVISARDLAEANKP